MQYMRMTSLIFHSFLEPLFIDQVTGQECLSYVSTGTSIVELGLGSLGLCWCVVAPGTVIYPGSVHLPPGISHFNLFLLFYHKEFCTKS